MEPDIEELKAMMLRGQREDDPQARVGVIRTVVT
jgi:hypothetical protein